MEAVRQKAGNGEGMGNNGSIVGPLPGDGPREIPSSMETD